MSEASTPLIPPSFLFELSVPCLYVKNKWAKGGIELAKTYRIPSLHAELAGGPEFADFRLGWNETGLFLNLEVTNKSKKPWCVNNRIADSDRLVLLIDTRNTKNVYRVTKFCNHLAALPFGSKEKPTDPFVLAQKFAMSSYTPLNLTEKHWQAVSEQREDGYRLAAHISADAITGFDPSDYPMLGFTYVVVDRELGWQTLNQDPSFPFMHNPGLWGTLELVKR